MILLDYVILFLCNTLARFSTKRYSNQSNTLFSLCIYSAITGIFAMGIFLISAGFRISINPRTAGYALVYSVIVIVAHAMSLLTLRFVGLSESSIITSAGSLLLSAMTGFFLFREPVSPASILRVCLMMGAALSIFLTGRKKSGSSFHITPTGLALCIGSIFTGTANSIINKLFAMDPGVTDSNSFFFLTNLFLVLLAMGVILGLSHGKLHTCIKELRCISRTQYWMILLNTVASNISSLVSILILAQVSISLHVPLSSALSIISTGLVGMCIFREKPPLFPIFLSLLAVILGAFQ